jgi:hypothetical protein
MKFIHEFFSHSCARTLSGVLRLSPRRSQLTLKVQLELPMSLSGRSLTSPPTGPLCQTFTPFAPPQPAVTHLQRRYSPAPRRNPWYLLPDRQLPVHSRTLDARAALKCSR